MTILIRSPLAVASTAIGALPFSQAEQNVLAVPSLKAWWRAAEGVNPTAANTGGLPAGQWIDRTANGYKLAPVSGGTFPSLVTGLNGKPALHAAASGGVQLADPDGRNLFPVSGDWTLVLVGKNKATTAQNLLFNGANSLTGGGLYYRSDGLFQVYLGNASQFVSSSSFSGAHLLLLSMDSVSPSLVLRVDGTQAQTPKTSGIGSNANTATVTMTIASPGVVTWTGHTLANNEQVVLTTTGALPTGLTAGTTYYARNVATNTFELSATSGGASINTSGSQSGVHTATAPKLAQLYVFGSVGSSSIDSEISEILIFNAALAAAANSVALSYVETYLKTRYAL